MTTTTHTAWVFKGTGLDVMLPASVQYFKKMALEMIMGMLTTPEFYKDKKKLGDFFYGQTEYMEQLICNNSEDGYVTSKCIKKAAKDFFGDSPEKFRVTYCGNIAALLILKRIKNNNDFGHIEISGLEDLFEEHQDATQEQKSNAQSNILQMIKEMHKKANKKNKSIKCRRYPQ